MRFAVLAVVALIVPLAAGAQPARPSPFDGKWEGVWSCGSSLGGRVQNASWAAPYSTKRAATVANGEIDFGAGTQGQKGYRELNARIDPNGTVSANGFGLSVGDGGRYRLWIQGRFDGDKFMGAGGEGDRSCILELVRSGPPPARLPGRVESAQGPGGGAQPRPASAPGPNYDGLYRGTFECVPADVPAGRRPPSPATLRRDIVIVQGRGHYEFVGERVREEAEGRVDPQGRVVLRGQATNNAGERHGVAIEGGIAANRLTGKAEIARGVCKIDLARIGDPPPSMVQAFGGPPPPPPGGPGLHPPPPPPPAQARPQQAAIARHDGIYRGMLSCGESPGDRRAGLANAGGFSVEREIVVFNGQAQYMVGAEGQPGSQFADGRTGPDGRTIVEGRGVTDRRVSYTLRFDLGIRGDDLTGSAKFGDRDCEVRFSRGGGIRPPVQEARAPAPAAPPPKPAEQPDGSKALLELALWDAVKGSSDPKLYRDYLKKYPEGHFATVAKSRIAEIQKDAKTQTASAPAPAPAASEPQADIPPEILNEKRLALVIGNSDYKSLGRLPNPGNDAKAMAASLRRLNFTVIERTNVSRDKMSEAIDEFGSKLQAGGVGLFFFAGHGMQVRGQNYLLPIEANPKNEIEVQGKAVNAAYVLEHMAEARNRVNLVILDACRNNPLQTTAFRSASRGLAVVGRAPGGTIIAYATAPDAVAEDGDDSNGLYTSELLKHLETPGLKIEDVLKRVTSGVRTRSNGNQIPWTTGSLEGDFYFKLPGRRG